MTWIKNGMMFLSTDRILWDEINDNREIMDARKSGSSLMKNEGIFTVIRGTPYYVGWQLATVTPLALKSQ